jgi:hypothetical protein
MLTSDNFEQLSWHDNAIHGFRILEGDDNTGGKLLLDIDFIAEWLQGPDKSFNFKIVPSDLTFSEISDLVISVDYAAATAAVQPITINEIIREVVTYPNGYSSYSWKIDINWPPKSFISFQAGGFTQVPRMEPIVSGAQYLSPSERDS